MQKTTDPILSIRHLTHIYGTKTAVDNISIDFHPSTIYGLLGSNGAGKSTTMNIMCGVLKPTAGDVWVNGIAMKQKPEEAKRQLGFLPQKPPLHTELTVREYLRYCAGLRQIPHKQIGSSVAEVIERCMLSEYQGKLIGALSGGYQQRVGIAQAIIHKPTIVVFDEPTNGLDPNQTETIRSLIQEIAQERTVILSTHILPEVEASCQHICMIEQGRLVFNGSIQAFRSYVRPNSLLVSFAHPPEVSQLQAFTSVKAVDALSENSFRVFFEGDGEPLVDELVFISVQNSWMLREIGLEKSSPERIFSAIAKHTIQ